jgi:hypothetical protein
MDRSLRILPCVFAILTLSASPALSCTCAPKASVSVAIASSWSNAVFVGRVTARHDAKIECMRGQSSWGYSFDFEVEKLYKGALSSEVAVLTGNGHGDCGYPFVVGERYLVYAYGEKELGTNM